MEQPRAARRPGLVSETAPPGTVAVHTPPGGGHVPFLEARDAVARILAEHLRSAA